MTNLQKLLRTLSDAHVEFILIGGVAARAHGSARLTDDVDITWRIQMAGWSVAYEPKALCWILMPETLGGLWRQRLRWSEGGTQTALRLTPRNPGPVHGGLAVRGGVGRAADALDRLADRAARGVAGRALEGQVLHEVGDAGIAGPLEPRAGEDVRGDGHRAGARQAGGDDTRPLGQLGPGEHAGMVADAPSPTARPEPEPLGGSNALRLCRSSRLPVRTTRTRRRDRAIAPPSGQSVVGLRARAAGRLADAHA